MKPLPLLILTLSLNSAFTFSSSALPFFFPPHPSVPVIYLPMAGSVNPREFWLSLDGTAAALDPVLPRGGQGLMLISSGCSSPTQNLPGSLSCQSLQKNKTCFERGSVQLLEKWGKNSIFPPKSWESFKRKD